MRSKWMLCVALAATSAVTYAKEPKAYQTGKLVQMDFVRCGGKENDAQSTGDRTLLDDSGNKKCHEYVLETDHVIYRIRPRNEKHPVLLPVGELAQFRIAKDDIMLRVDGINNKERSYTVISIAPRSENNTADVTPLHLNHLQ